MAGVPGPRPRRRRAPGLLAVGWAVAAGIALAPGPARAGTPDLSTIVLAQTLPGLVAEPPGPSNGPITEANASAVDPEDVAAVDRDLANGSLTGYVRVWSHDPPDGDDAIIVAYTWDNPDEAAGFVAGAEHSAQVAGDPFFDVPGIPAAVGFSGALTLSGAPSTVRTVVFARGSTAFGVELVTTTGDITTSEAIEVAARQAAAAPGPAVAPLSPSSTPPGSYELGEGIVFLLIPGIAIGIIAVSVSRSRNRRRPDYPPSPLPAPPPVLPPEWRPTEVTPSAQGYWDGTTRWDGTGWKTVEPWAKGRQTGRSTAGGDDVGHLVAEGAAVEVAVEVVPEEVGLAGEPADAAGGEVSAVEGLEEGQDDDVGQPDHPVELLGDDGPVGGVVR